MTIEDETGTSNIVVHTQIFEKFRPEVLGSRLVRVTGRLQIVSDVIHVIAERIEDLSSWLNLLTREEPQATSGHKTLPESQGNRTAPAQAAGVAAVMPKGRNFH